LIALPLIRHVEWRLVVQTAGLAALAFLAARLIDGGLAELLSLFAGFGATGYLASHRARHRPLVQGVLAVGLALGVIGIGILLTERGLRNVARTVLVLTPFATAPGLVGILAGRADRELRPRRTAPVPLPVDDLSRAVSFIWRARREERAPDAPDGGDGGAPDA
jgi:hypothetical protein